MKEQGPILIIKHAKTRHDADAAILSGLHPTPVETIETPTRTYRLTDSEGKAPPLVPTVEALETWGEHWWVDTRDEELGRVIALVWVLDGVLVCAYVGNHWPDPVDDSISWLGPVTERTKETP